MSMSSTRYTVTPVLDLQLDSDLEALPVGGCLGDVVTNLLWRQTQWTHLVKIEMRTKLVTWKRTKLVTCKIGLQTYKVNILMVHSVVSSVTLGAKELVAPTSPPTALR